MISQWQVIKQRVWEQQRVLSVAGEAISGSFLELVMQGVCDGGGLGDERINKGLDTWNNRGARLCPPV